METIDLGESPSAQEVFDAVVAHLRSAPKQAISVARTCLYETPEGLRCAIGIFLSGDALQQEGNVHDLIHDSPSGTPGWLEDHSELLGTLQSVHDTSWNWSSSTAGLPLNRKGPFNKQQGEEKLRFIAQDNDLTYTPREAA